MGAVDQNVDAARVETRDQFLDRKDHGRRAGDVVEQGQPRALGDPFHHPLDNFVGRTDRNGYVDHHEPRARPLGHVASHVRASVVFMVGR